MKIAPSKRQMPSVPSNRQVLKPIKLLEGIRNGGNGALVRSTAILWTNDQYFILLRSVGVYGKPSPADHLRIYILCSCQRTRLYLPMLILACLTGVSGLVILSTSVSSTTACGCSIWHTLGYSQLQILLSWIWINMSNISASYKYYSAEYE